MNCAGEEHSFIGGAEPLHIGWNTNLHAMCAATSLSVNSPHQRYDRMLNSSTEPGVFAGPEPFSSPGPVELINRVRGLEAEILSLQALVCDLLCENEQLRWRDHAIE